jgi:hypothetical protein
MAEDVSVMVQSLIRSCAELKLRGARPPGRSRAEHSLRREQCVGSRRGSLVENARRAALELQHAYSPVNADCK